MEVVVAGVALVQAALARRAGPFTARFARPRRCTVLAVWTLRSCVSLQDLGPAGRHRGRRGASAPVALSMPPNARRLGRRAASTPAPLTTAPPPQVVLEASRQRAGGLQPAVPTAQAAAGKPYRRWAGGWVGGRAGAWCCSYCRLLPHLPNREASLLHQILDKPAPRMHMRCVWGAMQDRA